MKIVAIGDPHFKKSNHLQTEVMVREIERCLAATHPDLIVCLGDTLDKFSDYNERPFNRALDFLAMLRNHARTYVLIGNHDLPTNAHFCSTQHPFNALKQWSAQPYPITVVDEPVMDAEHGLVLCPYVPAGRFVEALDRVPGWRSARLIFAHQDIANAVYRGQASTEGDRWNPAWPMLVSGHIHDYQEVGPNVLYPGSPLQHAFDESADKALSVLSLSGVSTVEHTRWPLTVPVYYTVHLTASQIESFEVPIVPPLSEVKLMLEGSTAEIKAWRKSTKVKAWLGKGYKIQYHRHPDSIQRRDPSNRAAWHTVSFQALLRRELESADAGLAGLFATL